MIHEWSAALARETAVYAWGLVAGSLGAMFFWSYWRRRLHLGRDAALERLRTEAAPLVAGDTVLYGRVDERDGDAVMLEIEQKGVEWSDESGEQISWREVARRFTARPFYLVRPNGERVRVEPGPSPELVDEPDVTRRSARDRRVRVSRLAANEPIYVTGRLRMGADPRAGGYRDSAEQLILVPPALGGMRLSTVPEEHAERARTHRSWMIALAVILFLAELPYGNFYMRLLFGRVVTATISSLYETESEDDEGHVSYTDHIIASGDGSRLEDVIPSRIMSKLKVGDKVPFVVVRGVTEQLGDRAFVDAGPMPFLLFVAPTAFLYWRLLRRVPWYRRRRLDESESGRLDG
jgi:hypothetical protein